MYIFKLCCGCLKKQNKKKKKKKEKRRWQVGAKPRLPRETVYMSHCHTEYMKIPKTFTRIARNRLVLSISSISTTSHKGKCNF